MLDIDSYEYNPCIRKGKHKPKHKKQKKYQAKIQKTNLIRPKRHKLTNDTLITNQKLFNELSTILLASDTTQWNEDYEQLYRYVFKLEKNVDYALLYNEIQVKIIEDQYDDYDDDDWYESYKYRYRYDRW